MFWTSALSPFSCCPPARLPLFPGSAPSAQSVPAQLAAGGLADPGGGGGECSSERPLKAAPSGDILCSAYPSSATLSAPSLCAPTPGWLKIKTRSAVPFAHTQSMLACRDSPQHNAPLFLTVFSLCAVSVFCCTLSPSPSPILHLPHSGCVKLTWGSERLALKPGGRRTRFLSTPRLALCV